ncbi:phosphoribosylanthranilate isomerase [Altererythrobacter lutimaris]|uniref:N-(5'-phosphoribosyl)anthranilate isomerase n=1 Tax=Altererythrobacter lutimaris TaxID=2743979 RepID=A0A850HA60_9SPHN|nr:phosphoribosylanthranilate isomerase [Altererythrobacter lutimaris]NVE93786.1 phosphoribosylanthranilate isomerase [Altererythrobacter lutimaris]
MPNQIKICGLTTPETIAASIDAGATHIGLNFYPPSPRFVSVSTAAQIVSNIGNEISKVGVFVDATDGFIEQNLRAGALDILQLHGKETPDRVREVKAKFGLPVWKVLSVETAEDVTKAVRYADVADFLLFDTKTPKGALPGGMGLGFDWGLLEAYDGALPWGLAGGLTPENVAEAIRQTGTTLVDTSSGVETAPGIKDVDLIAAFCKAAREA